MVRAKFKCDFVSKFTDTATVNMVPVTNGSEENKSFYKWTPGGSIILQGISHTVADKFVPGKEYYVDFTEAE